MKYVLLVLMILVIAAIIAIGEIYFRADRERTAVDVAIRQMRNETDELFVIVLELLAASGDVYLHDECRRKRISYNENKAYRKRPAKITAVNDAVDLLKSLPHDVKKTLDHAKLRDLNYTIEGKRSSYNLHASKYNEMIAKPIYKMYHLKPVPILCDFTMGQ